LDLGNSADYNIESSIMEVSHKSFKDTGRWTIYESEKYMEVLRKNENSKNLIKELRSVLPGRAETQIRAHHQKMLKKYGSIRDIIRIGGRSENYALTNISHRLDGNLGKFKALISQLALSLDVNMK
jgi:NADH dehydrogenase/NADH:ubiquinone oxidoreductase subunit G